MWRTNFRVQYLNKSYWKAETRIAKIKITLPVTTHKTGLPAALIHKGKAVHLEAWSGPEGSRKLSFPDIMKTAQDGGKVVGLTHQPPLPPENTPGTHFC